MADTLRALLTAYVGSGPWVPADAGTPGFQSSCWAVETWESLCDNGIASVSSSEKLREKHTWSVPASGSFGKRPQWAMPKGRKQRWWDPRFCHQSNYCAWSLGPNYPRVSSLRESPLTSWVVIMGASLCVHGYLCVYVCVEARNGCWTSPPNHFTLF